MNSSRRRSRHLAARQLTSHERHLHSHRQWGPPRKVRVSSNTTSTPGNEERSSCCPQTATELRRAYFAQAGETATRYGVRFERVLDHLDVLRLQHSQQSIPVVRYLEDLIHAVACLDDVDLAWRDLGERHERALSRACRQRMPSSSSAGCWPGSAVTGSPGSRR